MSLLFSSPERASSFSFRRPSPIPSSLAEIRRRCCQIGNGVIYTTDRRYVTLAHGSRFLFIATIMKIKYTSHCILQYSRLNVKINKLKRYKYFPIYHYLLLSFLSDHKYYARVLNRCNLCLLTICPFTLRMHLYSIGTF